MPRLKLPPISAICLIGFILIEPSVYLGLILLSILIHEAGHLAVMAAFGIGIEEITVLPLGINIKRKEKYISYPQEAVLSLGGAAANLLMFFIFGEYSFFAYTNLLYAAVNLLPIKGLDGGYALEAFLLCFFSYESTQKVLRTVSFVFCIFLWMIGTYIFLILNGNISIFALSVFLFITVIMKEL